MEFWVHFIGEFIIFLIKSVSAEAEGDGIENEIFMGEVDDIVSIDSSYNLAHI